jgi:tetratricopeptide (TPR) repeat protein
LLSYAGRAPRFPAEYREQFPAFVVECLVRAVELRLQSLSPGKVAESLQEADADGYILVRPLYERLKAFETAEPAMTFYFPDLLAGIDLPSEAARLEKVKFAPAREMAPRVSEPVAQISESERLLAEGDALIADRKPQDAEAAFRAVLEKEPGNLRALYGAGVAATLQRDVERAKELFQQVIAGAAQAQERPATLRWLAWSHVYLGRIYDVEGKRELALTEFRAALAIPEAPRAVRDAAQRGIEQGYRPARPETKPQR